MSRVHRVHAVFPPCSCRVPLVFISGLYHDKRGQKGCFSEKGETTTTSFCQKLVSRWVRPLFAKIHEHGAFKDDKTKMNTTGTRMNTDEHGAISLRIENGGKNEL